MSRSKRNNHRMTRWVETETLIRQRRERRTRTAVRMRKIKHRRLEQLRWSSLLTKKEQG